MNTKDLEDQKIMIEKKIQELDDEILDLKESSKPVKPDNSIGRLSRMDAINLKSINEKALKNLQTKREKLIGALKKIAINEYGECIVCGEEIELKRLKAVPEATICIDCSN